VLIAQITDLHVRRPGDLAYGFVDTNAMLADAVQSIIDSRPLPDVVLATGDLVDTGSPDEFDALAALLVPLPMSVYLIPGNHDHRGHLRAAFSDHPYWPDTGTFLHYVVDGYPVRLIGLDTVIEGRTEGEMCAERIAWLDARLAEAPERPTLIFMHHPPFATGLWGMDDINCLNGDAMAAVIARYPCVERVVCGHYHRPIQRRWAGTVASIAPSTAHQVALDLSDDGARAGIAMEPPAYHLHLWRPDTGIVTHTVYTGDFVFRPKAKHG
jgi:3',5'-cyclic AMP phosphodiesterase CpdA